ncbi:sulfiredoxin [Synechococcus sp. W70.1]|uniref:sulfiredoxin n=1 Tax=Synechococcus sp. W70.1 TaxID=2964534 RepID=UPI0039C25254
MVEIREIPLAQIRRPLPRQTDPGKVRALMASIQEIGLQEPIEVLEVEGKYYSFSGCHRYEAFVRLGRDRIPCRVRRATPAVLRLHLA